MPVLSLRLLRTFVAGGALLLGLGCMGLVDDLTDLDIEMQYGDSARHPEDFPVGPPSTGSRTAFIAMTTDAESINLPDGVELDLPPDQPMRMETVTYTDVLEADWAALPATLEAAGYRLEKTDAQAMTFLQDDRIFIMIRDGTDLVLIRLVPTTPATPPPAAP